MSHTSKNAKINKYWYSPLQTIIENEGFDEEGNDLQIDLNDAMLILSVLDARTNGEKDIVSILQNHNIVKNEEQVEEEYEEVDEIDEDEVEETEDEIDEDEELVDETDEE